MRRFGLLALALLLAGAALGEGNVVRVEDSDLFVKHVDGASGVVSYFLRPGLVAENQQSIYFTAKSMTDDGRFIVFWIADNEMTFKPTAEKPERLMGTAVLDLKLGKATRIPVPPQIPFLDVKTARLWYISPSPATLLPHCDWRPSATPWNDEIRYIDLAVDPTAEHTVCKMPQELTGPGHVIDVYSTHLTLSHDRTRMFLGVFVDGRYEQGCVNLETGRWEKWAATRDLNTNHDQINPVRDDVALIASDDCWTLPKAQNLMKTSGWYPRVWLVRRDGRRELQPIRVGRYATHENWNQDGSGLYWCGNAGVVRQDLATGAQECVAPRKAAHATMSYDMRYVTFDAAVDRWWRGCPWRVSFWNRDVGRGVYIHTANEALCDDPKCPLWHDHPDPHPQFVCNDRYIICTVNHADGHMDLSVTPVAPLVEMTARGDSACFGPDPATVGLEGVPLWFETQEEGRLRREVPYFVNAGVKQELKRRWELVRAKAEAALAPACEPTEARYSLYTALLAAEALEVGDDEGPSRWRTRLAAIGGVPAGFSEIERHRFLLKLPASLWRGLDNDVGMRDGAYRLVPADGSDPGFAMSPTPLGFQLTTKLTPGQPATCRVRSHIGYPFVVCGDWKVRDMQGRAVPTRRTRFGECVFETEEAADYVLEAIEPGKGEKIKVACIGDSITYGTGLKDRAHEGYPRRLQELLDAKFPGRYEVRNFGNPGRGVYLDEKIIFNNDGPRGYRHMKEHAAALAWQPDIVVSNLGINDLQQYPEEAAGKRPRGQFVRDYLALLGEYRKLPSNPKLFVWTRLAPLTKTHRSHLSETPFKMVTALAEVARRTHATEIDMYLPFMPEPDAYFIKDGVHPNPAGARKVAEVVFAALCGGGL